jgi:quercetin dioxygenase-like cupin family protein
MNINNKWLVCGAAAAALLALSASAGQVQATPSTATSTTLAQATISRVGLAVAGRTAAGKRWGVQLTTRGATDGYVVDNKFQPGQSTGWHSHPGPSLIFVVTGEVTNYESTRPHCAGKTHTAGTTFLDKGGTDVHMLRNEGTSPAETIAVQLIPAGQSRRIDEPEPANCHT